MRPLTIREDIEIEDPARFVKWYLDNVRRGPTYYARSDVNTGNTDTVGLADLGWAVLLEGRPSSLAAMSLIEQDPIDITAVPRCSLHKSDSNQRELVVKTLSSLTALPGFGSSVASKVLHPKRRHSVPVLDNRAIFGSFCRPDWRPGDSCAHGSVSDRQMVEAALEAIYMSVAAPGNQVAWQELETLHDRRFTRIELFDMIWWVVAQAPSTLKVAGSAQSTCSLST